jgi:ABC-type transporter Mla subunit MlaD
MSVLDVFLGGADLPGAIKTATDHLADLRAQLTRSADNTAAIALRLDAIDARQDEIFSLLQNLFSQAEHKETGT